MSQMVRFNMQISKMLNDDLERMAEDSACSKTDVLRQALALFKVAHDAKKAGRHIGLVLDVSKLDTEIIGLL